MSRHNTHHIHVIMIPKCTAQNSTKPQQNTKKRNKMQQNARSNWNDFFNPHSQNLVWSTTWKVVYKCPNTTNKTTQNSSSCFTTTICKLKSKYENRILSRPNSASPRLHATWETRNSCALLMQWSGLSNSNIRHLMLTYILSFLRPTPFQNWWWTLLPRVVQSDRDSI